MAIVTGGGGGIGRGVCRLLAEEGASVVVIDVGGAVDGTGTSTGPADELVSEIKENGGVAVSNYDTIATMEGAGKLVQAAIDNFGRVDILLHVAGIPRDRMVFNMTEEEWDAIDSALADYQDYGEKETDLMNSIGDKMQTLFAPRYQDETRHPESGAN